MKIRWKKSNRNIMKNSARICTSKIMSTIACCAITESPVRIHDYLKISSEKCQNIPFSDFPENKWSPSLKSFCCITRLNVGEVSDKVTTDAMLSKWVSSQVEKFSHESRCVPVLMIVINFGLKEIQFNTCMTLSQIHASRALQHHCQNLLRSQISLCGGQAIQIFKVLKF